MPRLIGPGFLTALALAALLASGSQALASHVQCGDVITQDTTLDADLIDCPGDGIVIGADGITLDLGGHTIDGTGWAHGSTARYAGVVSAPPGPDCFGICQGAHDRITIRRGAIREFDSGVLFIGGDHGLVSELAVSGSLTGIRVIRTRYTQIRGARAFGNVYGMNLNGVSHASVSGNVAVASTDTGIEAEHVTGSRIERNLLSGNADGLHLHNASENVVSQNLVVGNSSAGLDVSNDVDRNRISDNTVVGGIRGITVGEEATDNLIEGNRVSAGRPGSPVAGGLSGIVINGPNRARANTVSGYARGVFICCNDGAHLVRNRIFGNDVGVVVGSGATRIEANRILRNRTNGIVLRPESWTLGGNRVQDNRVTRNGGDGLFIGSHAEPAVAETIIAGNVLSRNEDDGVDIESVTTTVVGNRANINGDLGIEAVSGVTDGGGNRASGNGNPLQCLNVACR